MEILIIFRIWAHQGNRLIETMACLFLLSQLRTTYRAVQLAEANAIKRLILPQKMSETFKVIGPGKNVSGDLSGIMPCFDMNDMRIRLLQEQLSDYDYSLLEFGIINAKSVGR